VEHSAPLYVAARTKLEKTQVIASVVDKVRRDSPGRGFVKRDFHTGHWFEIGDDKARDKVGHAIRRAVEESKNKKEPRSKQAKKSNKNGKTLDDDNNSETSSPFGQEKNEKTNKAANQHRGEGKLASAPIGSHRAFPPGTGADSLVVPPFLYSRDSNNIDASQSFQHSSDYTHSMQHNLVVPPGSANSSLFSSQQSMGLLSRGKTSRPAAGDILLGGSSSMTSQFNHPDTASADPALITNQQFNPALLDGLMFSGDAGSLNNQQFHQGTGGASQSGSFSMLNHRNAATSGSFTTPALVNHQINITSSGLANQFGQVNHLDPGADSSALFSNQFNQIGNRSLFAGSSNHMASLTAREDAPPFQYSQQNQYMSPPVDFQPHCFLPSSSLSAPLGASPDRNSSLLFTGGLSASSSENHLIHHSAIFPAAVLVNREAGAPQGAGGDRRPGGRD
jgi:hypothetical protein